MQLKLPGFVLHIDSHEVVQVFEGVSVQVLEHSSTYWTLQLIDPAVQFDEHPVEYSYEQLLNSVMLSARAPADSAVATPNAATPNP